MTIPPLSIHNACFGIEQNNCYNMPISCINNVALYLNVLLGNANKSHVKNKPANILSQLPSQYSIVKRKQAVEYIERFTAACYSLLKVIRSSSTVAVATTQHFDTIATHKFNFSALIG